MTTTSIKRPSDRNVSPPPSKRSAKQLSTTTNKVVANFFAPKSQKEPEKLSWSIVQESLVVGCYNLPNDATSRDSAQPGQKTKVAAFDFDSTLIKTISRNKFAKDANDWQWWHGSVPGKLQELHREGYCLVIISNQNGISLRKPANAPKVIKNDRFSQFKQKAAAVFNNLNVPISVYAATERDRFRKPATGMWEAFLKDHALAHDDLDMDHSIFVGDAGGRKDDFSCSDRNLAANVGIPFKTPEEFFLNEEPQPYTRSFDPLNYLNYEESGPPFLFKPFDGQEIALFVGSPGAGKSTFFHRYLEPLGYVRVNQDILRSRERCLEAASMALKEGKSVAIDNTNPDQEVRWAWTSLATKHDVPIRCFQFTTSKDMARHNDVVRALSGSITLNPESRHILPQLAFNTFGSRYQEPKVQEGFTEVIQVPFKVEGSEEDRKIWSRYWT